MYWRDIAAHVIYVQCVGNTVSFICSSVKYSRRSYCDIHTQDLMKSPISRVSTFTTELRAHLQRWTHRYALQPKDSRI